jgi:phosphoglycolate phosphatase-like HAD superfamily hydrolase
VPPSSTSTGRSSTRATTTPSRGTAPSGSTTSCSRSGACTGTWDLVEWTTKDDVEASKPEPDLVHAALEKARTDDAVMVGDTPWDVEVARKSGLDTVCVVTGGLCAQELRDAGAVAVFESLQELREHLEEIFA